MRNLTEQLVDAGVITPEEARMARRLQERLGGKVGPLLVSLGAATQADVDRIWLAGNVTQPLESAIDRAAGNRFTAHTDRQINYVRVHRHDTVIEDMTDAARVKGAECMIHGEATVTVKGQVSLPFRFSIDLGNGFALLDDAGEAMMRRWISMHERQGATAAAPATAG